MTKRIYVILVRDSSEYLGVKSSRPFVSDFFKIHEKIYV